MRFSVPVSLNHASALKVVALAVVLALSLPTMAVAGPLSALDVTLLLQPQGSLEPLLLVAGRLPEGTPLPAELVIPVPEGIEGDVAWAGEILGGPVENDPAADPRFEVRDGVNVAVFTLTQSDIGQIEIVYPAGTSVLADDLRAAALELAVPGEVGTARIAVALPPGFEAASLPEGTLTSQADGGTVYYYTESANVPAGDTISIGLEYRGAPVGTGAMPVQQSGQSGEIPAFLIILVGLVLAGAVLLVLTSRSKQVAEEDEPVQASRATADEVEVDDTHTLSADAVESESDGSVDAGSDPDVAAAPAVAGISTFLTPKVLLIGAALLVLAVFVVVNLGGESGQVGVTETSGTVVSQRISTASAGEEVSYSLMIPCDCPPEAEAVKMFDVLRQVPGISHAAFDTVTLVMNVQFDPGVTQSGSIEERLRAAGYLR